MNIYSRDNPVAWKLVKWRAKYRAGKFPYLWQGILDLLKSNRTFNFLDCIKLVNVYANRRDDYLQSTFRKAMREAITLANKRKRAGYYGNDIDAIFKDIEV